MNLYPTTLEIVGGNRLQIAWSDETVREYSVRELRDRCPCATCREKRAEPPSLPTELTVLSPAEAQPLTLAGMKPVGSYAYNIAFSDGHNTGIFTFESLLAMGTPV